MQSKELDVPTGFVSADLPVGAELAGPAPASRWQLLHLLAEPLQKHRRPELAAR